jgi:hypothetical protein
MRSRLKDEIEWKGWREEESNPRPPGRQRHALVSLVRRVPGALRLTEVPDSFAIAA